MHSLLGGSDAIRSMKRREFITLLGGAAAAWPLAARAQQQELPVVGLLWVASERVVKPYEESIRAGLRELGWVDGGNYRLEVRYGNGEATRLTGLIDELIALNPKVLSGISEVPGGGHPHMKRRDFIVQFC